MMCPHCGLDTELDPSQVIEAFEWADVAENTPQATFRRTLIHRRPDGQLFAMSADGHTRLPVSPEPGLGCDSYGKYRYLVMPERP